MFNYENKKLLKTTDDIFVEHDSLQDGKRPLEWRRNFNYVKFNLNNLKLISSFRVHEIDFDLDNLLNQSDDEAKPNLGIKPSINHKITLLGELDEDSFRDAIYIAVVDSKEEKTFSIEHITGTTKVTLTAGHPTEGEDGKTPRGLYPGHALRCDYDGEDYLAFDLTLPAEQMDQIISAFKEDENSTIEVAALLRSYTFEVDDFFREYSHPRNIIIDDSTLCFLSWISISSKVGKHYIKLDLDNQHEDDEYIYQTELTPEQQNQQAQLRVLESYAKPLNNIAHGIWLLIIILILQTIF